MEQYTTDFEKECLCFRCPLEDCRTPCPFGMDRNEYIEDVDQYLETNDVFIKQVIENEKRKEKKREYFRDYYLKRKEKNNNTDNLVIENEKREVKRREYYRNYYLKRKEKNNNTDNLVIE